MLRLAAFDMDGTLVDVASSWRVVHDAFDDHNDEALRLFLENRIDDREFIRSDIRKWRAHRPRLSTADLEEILGRVPLMPGATELFDRLRSRGVATAIISGGIDLLARRIGRELGVDHILANGVETTAEGRLTGEGIVRVPIRDKESVLAALQAATGIPPGATASVGNSEIDAGLFRRSRLGIAFLPEDETVRRAAGRVVERKDLREVARLLDEFPG
ncbi:MAG: HAD-IB family phosphatase [Thermoplasmata archaeon]